MFSETFCQDGIKLIRYDEGQRLSYQLNISKHSFIFRVNLRVIRTK